MNVKRWELNVILDLDENTDPQDWNMTEMLEIGNGEGLINFTARLAEEQPVKDFYVNVYRVDRCYGGPEEGGWWYDAGEPIAISPYAASIKCETIEMARALADKIRADLANEQPERNRFSLVGGPDLEVYIEDHPAMDFPSGKPHYE